MPNYHCNKILKFTLLKFQTEAIACKRHQIKLKIQSGIENGPAAYGLKHRIRFEEKNKVLSL